jgi:DNA-binding response OmpR family regulator
MSIRSNTVEKRRRALLLDTDPDTLITLQHALEEADIDATVTWDETEARQLIEATPFDLILVGDHPPELNAAAILDDLSLRGTCPPVLILRGVFGEKDAEYFRRLGAIGVVPKRDAQAVLEHVTRVLAPVQLKENSAKVGLTRVQCLINVPIRNAPRYFADFATASVRDGG